MQVNLFKLPETMNMFLFQLNAPQRTTSTEEDCNHQVEKKNEQKLNSKKKTQFKK